MEEVELRLRSYGYWRSVATVHSGMWTLAQFGTREHDFWPNHLQAGRHVIQASNVE